MVNPSLSVHVSLERRGKMEVPEEFPNNEYFIVGPVYTVDYAFETVLLVLMTAAFDLI